MATYDNIKRIKFGGNIYNLYDSGNSGGTITGITTSVGAHTTVNKTSGAVSFNVPTKTSHLTNDSGFLTSHQDISGKSNATNWLNGSVTGSVRTSGSAVEDSSYTIGNYAVAEGYNTKASGANSHAEGSRSTASGADSHAEGYKSTASGDYSHAEGTSTTASGYYSHSGGSGTTAQRKSQTVIGEYNVLDTTGSDGTVRGSYAFIIGNGTSSTRSNALTVDWSGNVNIPSGAKYKINGTALAASSNTTGCSIVGTVDSSDNTQLNITISDSGHVHSIS